MKLPGIVLIVVFMLSSLNLFSQELAADTVVVKEVTVFVKENNKSVGYRFKDTKNDVIVFGDSLKIKPAKYKFNVSLADVNMFRLVSGNKFKEMATIGAGVGFIAGFFLGSSFTMHSGSGGAGFWAGLLGGVLGAIPFSLIIGLPGLAVDDEKDFEIPDYSSPQKRALILKILRDNRAK